jgi:hypothetical protein
VLATLVTCNGSQPLRLVFRVREECWEVDVRATVGSEVGDLSEHVGSSEVTLT